MNRDLRLVDAHIHFWWLSQKFDIWPAAKFETMARDFGPADLAAAYGGTLPEFVLVQAAPCAAETDALLALAARTPQALGVIGWIDPDAADCERRLAALARSPGFLGVRAEFEANGGVSTEAGLRRLADALDRAGLVLELLISPPRLTLVDALARDYPKLRLNVNHGGRPMIVSGEWDNWARDLATLGQRPNVTCKLSGLIERAGMAWRAESLRRYIGHILQCFGADRTLYASNWPVMGIAGRVTDWRALCEEEIANTLGADAVAGVCVDAARRFYRRGSTPRS